LRLNDAGIKNLSKKHSLSPPPAAFMPSDVPHSAKAITKCKVIYCFLPVREDFVELEKNTP
jgi:hypothetical protein